MFLSKGTFQLAQRATGALLTARSLLLLEDGEPVDWEVDAGERPREQHPHRMPLRGLDRPRRPGTPAPRDHVCISPVGGTPAQRWGRGVRGRPARCAA